MLIKDYRTQFTQELASIFDEKEIESFFYIVLDAFHQLKRVDLVLNPELELDSIQILQWETVLSQLKEQKPIQYILGETEFFGLPFYVNENTLIPRPETEELVEWIIKDLKNEKIKDLKILDIGTGSGCIAISLGKNLPNASVFAIDVSEKALATAKKNAELNDVKVTFIQKNILETEDLYQQFDIIVSNPPYVRNLEKQEIHKNVLEYEPHLALFVEDNDALIFYKKIAELATKNLSENGQLYFEINQYLGKEMIELLEKYDFKNIELKKDIYENDRMIRCVLKA
jgi:release factor glutamine methyltransferase